MHSQQERRYLCTVCGRTFAATRGTLFFRLQSPVGLVLVVLSLLSWGCPVQAIVHTFALDERTVAAWVQRAGQHCQQVHQQLVQHGQVDLQHVQADERWVKLVGQRMWQAMAPAVPSRLWLGGVLSPQRDQALILAVVQQVRTCASSLAILVCVDGLASYVTAFLRVFREPVRTGRRGRPRLVVEPRLLIGQVVKRYARRHVISTSQRVVRGTAEAIMSVLEATGTGTGMHTASIERLNATFRSHLAPLVRRGRAIAHLRDLGGWHVVGRHQLHPDLDARQPPGGGAGRSWTQVARADAGYGRGADRPRLDPPGPRVLPRATAGLGCSQAAWPPTKARPAALDATRSLTPAPCGATGPGYPSKNGRRSPAAAR